MRIRTIKPEFFDSPDTARASAVVRLAYIGLWCFADDHGRGPCNVKELEGAIFPNDDLSELSCGQVADFRGILPQLAAVYGVLFYEVDGRVFFQIPSWERHQRNRKGYESKCPPPEAGKLLEYCDKHEDASTARGDLPQVAADSRLEEGRRKKEEGSNTPLTPQRGAESATPKRSSKRSAKTPAADSPEFDQFWNTYPRRTAKPQARKAWERAVKRASVDVILAGTSRYAAECAALGTEDRYVAHPATWLNNDRWDDQPARPAASRDDGATQRAQGWLQLGLEAMNATTSEPPAAQHPQIGPSQPHCGENTPRPATRVPRGS